jgi:hypothetical protein
MHLLPPLDRAAQHRKLAAAAWKRSVEAESACVKTSELDMAARWTSLAQDIERRLELTG